MKPLALALCVAAATATAQAQDADERAPHRHANVAQPAQAPSPVSTLLKWLHDKSQPTPTKAADKPAPAPVPARTAEKPKPTPAKAEARHQEARHQEPRQAEVHRHRVKPVDEADAAPPVVTMTVAATRPAAAAADRPAVAAPVTRSINPTAVPSAAPVAGTDAAAPPAVPNAYQTASANPAVALDPPRDPAMPRTVATLSVMRPSIKALTQPGGYHGCSGGERIITAFYWEGRHTASGEPFNPDGFTAAHRTFPFGTRLLVLNPRNGKSVTVRVNDRGPFVKGVTLDLSRGAAKAIGMQGTGAVCIAKL
jgi:rare lipoprotein A